MVKTLSRFVPGFLKPYLRPLYERAIDTSKRLRYRQQSRNDLHAYWRKPPDKGNFPTDYLEGAPRSAWLVELVEKHTGSTDAKLLEIGCNIGRNLEHFYRAGFRNLNAIEINADAVRLLREHFPDMGKVAQIHVGPVEDGIKTFADDQFDVVYTMAVLEHIHEESAWVFREMVRVTKTWLVTIEDEREFSDRHFPRKYDQVFTALGMREVEASECVDVPTLGAGFFARVFRK